MEGRTAVTPLDRVCIALVALLIIAVGIVAFIVIPNLVIGVLG